MWASKHSLPINLRPGFGKNDVDMAVDFDHPGAVGVYDNLIMIEDNDFYAPPGEAILLGQ